MPTTTLPPTGASTLGLVSTAQALAATLGRHGYTPGVPEHLTDFARRVDAALVQALRCPHCQGRLRYHPYRQGTRYRVLAACVTCGYGEEF